MTPDQIRAYGEQCRQRCAEQAFNSIAEALFEIAAQLAQLNEGLDAVTTTYSVRITEEKR
jgi:hypothetical protein